MVMTSGRKANGTLERSFRHSEKIQGDDHSIPLFIQRSFALDLRSRVHYSSMSSWLFWGTYFWPEAEADREGENMGAPRSSNLLRLVFFFVALLVAQPGQSQEWIYTVRPGDNLWDLSERHLVRVNYWQQLQLLNDVADPYRLPPGSRLRIPIRWLKIQPIPARIVAATKDSQLARAGGGSTEGIAPGDLLYAGDIIRTGPNGSVNIAFADGSRLMVSPSSQIQMDRLTAYGDRGMIDSRLRLDQGRTETTVPVDRQPSTRFEIWTPAAVSAVRGTNLRVAVTDRAEKATTEVLTGKATVRAQRRTVRVRQGFGVVTERGRTPSAPIRLLPPPDLSTLPDVFESIPVRLKIDPVPGAGAYRVEFAETPAFETLLSQAVSTGPTIRGPSLPDGRYVFRIRAIDNLGLEGMNAVSEVEINALPEPPLPMQPIKEGKLRELQPQFRWSRPIDAVSYRFQLAAGEDFEKQIVTNEIVSDVSYSLARQISPGLYSWRVATVDSSGDLGPFSDPQKFEYKPAPSSPEFEEPEQSEGNLNLRWRAGTPGQRYRVQVSEDLNFSSLVVNKVVSEPQLTVSNLSSGKVFVRIQTIDEDGYAGSFSSPQSIRISPPDHWPVYLLPLLLLVLIVI